MKEAFVNHSLQYLIKNNACTKEQLNIFRYTLESLYSFFTKTFVVLILSIGLGTFRITFACLVLYSLLRGFTFGIHATKNLYCWIITLTVYSIFPFIIKYYTISTPILFILIIFGILSILLWAPADTPKRPLLNKKKRTTNKIIAIIISVFYILLGVLFSNSIFNTIVSFVLILNAICICPLTYKLFHIPFNNYKFYKN